MIRIHTYLLLAAYCLILTACDDITNLKKERSGGFNEELKRKKIKRITEIEFVEFAMKKGSELADSSQKILLSTLKNQVEKNGTEAAVSFCNINAYSLIDSMSKKNEASIKRVSLRLRNPNDKPDVIETQMLEAYQYSIENKQEVSPSIQKKGNELIYTRPIVIKDALCLKCHGSETDIDKATLSKLMELYPADNARNHKIGDLRGMWSIRFTKGALSKMMYDK